MVRKPSGLRSTTHRGDALGVWGLLEAPLDNCVVRAELRVLSLSLGGGRWVYLWRFGWNLGQILGDYQR